MRLLLLLTIWIFSGCSTKTYSERIALIVANGDYVYNTELKTPIIGAEKLQTTLIDIGFDKKNVFLLPDATFEQLEKKLKDIELLVRKNKIKNKEVKDYETILYMAFSGHGHTEQNKTSEAFFEMTDKDKNRAISNYYLYEKILDIRADHNIVSMDACLNLVDSKDKNIERIYGDTNKIPDNVFFAYATGFTEKALAEDPKSPYTPYTSELIEALPSRNSIQDIFIEIEKNIQKKIGQGQTPFHQSTLKGSIVFSELLHKAHSVSPR